VSKTDKTNPFWVQIKQNPELQKEVHDHRNGICDLKFRDQPWRDRYSCNYYVSYYSKNGRKIFGRCSAAEQSYRNEANGSARTQLRNTMSELRKMSLNDVYDHDVKNPHHRHQALWDVD
jgi:hypothetical protein